MKILMLYSSNDGQTKMIMSEIATVIAESADYELYNIHECGEINPEQYDAIIIGAAIRYGYFNRKVKLFIEQHHKQMNKIPSAFVSVNLIARKIEKRTPDTNSYTRKFLDKSPWKPDMCEVVAGALHYPTYNWFDRVMIQLIMKITGGETNATKDIEYTDWEQVKSFAKRFFQRIEK